MKISKPSKVILIVVAVLVASFYLISFKSVRGFLGIPEGKSGEECYRDTQNKLRDDINRLEGRDDLAREQRELLNWADKL